MRRDLVPTTARLVEFLRELVRTGTPTVRDVSQYEEVRWLADLPDELRAELLLDAGPGDAVISIDPVVTEPPPEPPESIGPFVAAFDDSSLPEPELSPEVPPSVRDESFNAVLAAWLDAWHLWAAQDRAIAPRREWFEFLTRLWRLLDQQDDVYELVIGTGVVSWATPHGTIQHPLLVTPVELLSDPATGRIDLVIATEGVTRISDRTLLEHQESFDPSRAEPLRDALRITPAAPLSDSTKDFLNSWRSLSLERARPYEHTWAPPGPPSAAPDIRFSPLLILRQRDAVALIDFYDRMLEHLSGPDAIAPLGLAQLIGPLEEEDRQAWLDAEGSRGGEDIAGDPLFPLPANPEQMQVIDRLRHDNGVAVQGPPGTGKSHTIANLISALLARGQRVLVTSQKAQALRVLRDKLPREIQQLCVSMTDLSRGGSRELNESVTALSDRYSTFSEAAHAERVKSVASLRSAAHADVGRITEEIRRLREAETVVHPPISAGYSGTKGAIAQRLHDNAACGWVPVPFPDDAPFDAPLTIQDVVELRRLLADTTPELAARSRQELPSLDSLPSLAQVTSMIAAEQAAVAAAERARDEMSQMLEPLDEAAFGQLRAHADTAAAALHELRTQPEDGWTAQAIRECFARTQATAWTGLAQTRSHAEHASRQISWLGLRQVSLPVFEQTGPRSLPGQLAAGRALATYLAGGHELKKRFRPTVQKDAELLLEGCAVDGVPITNLELLTVAVTALEIENTANSLAAQWEQAGVTIDGALPLVRRIAAFVDLTRTLDHILAAVAARDAAEAELARHNIRVPLATLDEWLTLVAALEAVATRMEAERATHQLADLSSQLALRGQHPSAPPELGRLGEAIGRRDRGVFEHSLDALAGAFAEQERQRRCDALRAQLHQAHPLLADLLAETAGDAVWDQRLASFDEAWAWGRARTYFDRLREPGLEERLTAELADAVTRRARATATLAAEEAWGQCLLRMTAHQEQALRAYQSNISERGAGTGKWAHRFAAAAREAMLEARGAVPAWIMPLREVVETIPPDQNSFDVVIIDEASQASIEALFLLWLAPRVIVVGDERQCAPSMVIRGQLQPIFDRLDDYLSDVPEYLRLAFTPRSNLFSVLATRFGTVIRLREHFRCMPEIISWSSRQFYSDAPLVPLRQFGADRLPPLQAVHVPDAYAEGTSTRLRNPLEAHTIVNTVVECAADPAYEDKTFGVIVLQGSGQIRLIEDLLTQALPPAEWERRRLRVGSPPDFQGDERDVMFLSMVIAERKPAVTHREWQRRFNVAASRARDQMWLFHSITLDLLSPADLRRSLLTYMLNPPAPAATSRFDELRWDSERIDPFDSKFEQRVFIALRDRGYAVAPQYEVNGRFIDLVVTGAKGRLAVECDGDHWHTSPEDQLADLDRELQLRRAGWEFWRVRESEFYLDPDIALEGLWEALDQRGIHPGDLATPSIQPVSANSSEWHATALADEEGLDGLDGANPADLDIVTSGARPIVRVAERRSREEERHTLFDADRIEPAPSSAELRQWARQHGLPVGERGRLHPDIIRAWNDAHPSRRFS